MAKVSKDGLNLIKKFEGLRLNAYLDSAGIPTIGFGTTKYPDGVKVKLGDKITEERALDLLQNHIQEEVIPYIDSLVKVPLNQSQVDALCSLIYNIGGNAFKSSTVLRKINSNALITEVETAWKLWNKAGGKVLQGLISRRLAEIKLYKQQWLN